MTTFKQSATLRSLTQELKSRKEELSENLRGFDMAIEETDKQITEKQEAIEEGVSVDEEVKYQQEIQSLEATKDVLNRRKGEDERTLNPVIKDLEEKVIQQLISDVKKQKGEAFEQARQETAEALKKYQDSLARFYEINNEGRDFIHGYTNLLGDFFDERAEGTMYRNKSVIYGDSKAGIEGITEPQQLQLINYGTIRGK
ncbi:hypothetical protein GLW08_08170 [Pontibacillus yanchengensis]|uniref:Uncharacterized protein n=1 Tax=Pontibacillus yanchengensis TaxID=462910 RepID=A0ACC7VEV4_9BACI|nr:hypothetical protein [Pontibacillus yanchengensis]MYL53313.1 hypothetical protein [Pontibacillus yanchengensis]